MKIFHFDFRPMSAADLPLLLEWLQRPHLQDWWHGETSLKDVRRNYLPAQEDFDTARPYIVYLNGDPVGYIQYYRVAEGKQEWWPDKPGAGVLGIDQFLADENQLNRGIGTAMITQFTRLLMKDFRIQEIRVDPHPDNIRAIRAFQKAGFREVGPITTPDGPALMMILRRDYSENT